MRSRLLSICAAAACVVRGSALQLAIYESGDCSGPPSLTVFTGTNRCTNVYGLFGIAPFQCAGASAQFVIYGDTTCGGAPAAGTLLSASTECAPLPKK